jgi:hypothetical protein
MVRRSLVPLVLLLCVGPALCQGPPKRTSLSDPKIKYRVPEKGYVVLKRAGVEVVIVDNRAVDDKVLPGHRAGYSGVASLRGPGRKENLFVPAVSGLNFEHIHDGTVQDRKILFEPRHAPMELRVIDDHTAELYQKATPHYGLESCLRYQLLEDGAIEMVVECIPRRKSAKGNWIGLFWASYIHKPASRAIHFKGREAGSKAEAKWIESTSPSHGVNATHPAVGDERTFKHDREFPLSLVFNLSKWRYAEPWYYGVSGDVAFAQVFRPKDKVRLSQSPTGGGKGNPAWDFQFFLEDYKVGQRYQMVMRAVLVKGKTREAVEKATAKHRLALGHPAR